MSVKKRQVLPVTERSTGKSKLIFEGGKYYIIGGDGKAILSDFDKIGKFKNGLTIFSRGGKKNIVTSQGVIILDKFYDDVMIDDTTIRICDDGKWGMTDLTGKVLFNPENFFVEKLVNGLARYEARHNAWGIIDGKGKIIVKPKYDYIGSLEHSVIVAKLGAKYGAIDIHDNVCVPFRYKHIGWQGEKTMLYNSATDSCVI